MKKIALPSIFDKWPCYGSHGAVWPLRQDDPRRDCEFCREGFEEIVKAEQERLGDRFEWK